MESVVLWVVANAFKGAVLATIFFVTHLCFSQYIKPRWKYIMWMLVAARLIMPPVLPTDFSFYNLGKFYGNDSERAIPRIVSKMAPDMSCAALDACGALSKKLGKDISMTQLIFFTWFAVAFSLLLLVVGKNRLMLFKVRRSCPCTAPELLDLLEKCRDELKVQTSVLLVETSAVNTPALLGFVRPYLLLPRGLADKISMNELRYIFIHELMHLKRFDIQVGWIIAFVQIVQWFNPFAWLALSKMGEARELACDESVLFFLKEENSSGYGKTIVRLLQFCTPERGIAGMAGIYEGNRWLVERLTTIKRFSRPPVFMVVLSIIILAFTGTVFLTEASEMKCGVPKANLRMKEKKMTVSELTEKNIPRVVDTEKVFPMPKEQEIELYSVKRLFEETFKGYGSGKTGILFSFQTYSCGGDALR